MTDSVTAARTAREKLAQGLAALQSPGVPQQLMDVAEPIALAMSCLHRIEASQGIGIGDAGASALNAVRRALAMLQSQPAGHPAINDAIEAVAGSLSLIHAIGQAATVQAVPAYAGTVVMDHSGPATQPSAPGYSAPQPHQQQGYPQAVPAAAQAYAPQAQPQPQWGAPPPAYGAGHPAPMQAGYAPAQQAQAPAWPPAAPQQAWPAQPVQPAAWPQQAGPAAPVAQAPAPAAAPAGAARGKGTPLRVEAELGAHSSTNFYKGLSGNDVIDSGGIFIATYQIPPIGQDLVIKVSMPGGYEFEAMGVVRWTRDAPLSGAEAPPGYGAQFTQISPEGRQLVYRYVRNREPLFHDDL